MSRRRTYVHDVRGYQRKYQFWHIHRHESNLNQALNYNQAALATCQVPPMNVTYLRAAPLPVGRAQLVRHAVQCGSVVLDIIVMCRYGWHRCIRRCGRRTAALAMCHPRANTQSKRMEHHGAVNHRCDAAARLDCVGRRVARDVVGARRALSV